MGFIIAFLLFLITMVLCLTNGISMAYAMAIGFLAFFTAAWIRGLKPGTILRASLHGIRENSSILMILLLIGCLTAAWRMSGVIAFFVYYGISQITPSLFLLFAFILSAIVSFALGTSVGTAGTAGVILMAIARSGGINELLAAGAILAGVYFGDRASPAASSANLVAELTHTDLYGNVKRMLRTSIFPLGFCAVAYTLFSLKNPLQTVDFSMLNAIATDFHISFWLVLPVAIMFTLPLFKVNVRITMACSTLIACVLAFEMQSMDILSIIKSCIMGYHPAATLSGGIWSGGGAFSMLEIIIIILIASTYPNILKESGALELLHGTVEKTMQKFGRSITVILYSFLSVGIFSSQLIATMMTAALLEKPYRNHKIPKEEFALDLENSVVIFATMVPWNMSCAIPLMLLGVTMKAVLFDYLIFAIPVFFFSGRILRELRTNKSINIDIIPKDSAVESKVVK